MLIIIFKRYASQYTCLARTAPGSEVWQVKYIKANAIHLRRTPPNPIAVHTVHSKAVVLLLMLLPLNVVFVLSLVIVMRL